MPEEMDTIESLRREVARLKMQNEALEESRRETTHLQGLVRQLLKGRSREDSTQREQSSAGNRSGSSTNPFDRFTHQEPLTPTPLPKSATVSTQRAGVTTLWDQPQPSSAPATMTGTTPRPSSTPLAGQRVTWSDTSDCQYPSKR
ncbi:uncharacterized protein MELLADRAFT_84857 [Melampsora larici-populina 98AG31]|uniref:Uncharacterized protein n=1 Tax=Melampsora larici-populina (strain 98AG31 / pathotype 3-4-7) TaxID=747676 RepID=F4SCQ9_MELLP|nr:uncharacterized protein MELLADRAFT_84857 [Melampsora larici-populina 98AG31]EGF97566.1 hypothetical protein MELLADRAFT_84857 [Melampsora larici-populina 98AG31]